ncbi:hypothetical protein T03_4783 [Trichinella britovi]|uniref:Uncharacterized protein n=1 Tax=Trichinella britovi TaxID=45882 RepID=A0A0V1DCH8_TRIBR|nr:hypothetical protein T03_4783 [Trichinella britovi]
MPYSVTVFPKFHKLLRIVWQLSSLIFSHSNFSQCITSVSRSRCISSFFLVYDDVVEMEEGSLPGKSKHHSLHQTPRVIEKAVFHYLPRPPQLDNTCAMGQVC